MFLRANKRFKDGKEHRYWSIVESRRTPGGRVVQRQVLYLGEINDSQRAAWCRTIEVLEHGQEQPMQVAIFPHDRQAPALDCNVVQIRLNGLQVHPPRQKFGYSRDKRSDCVQVMIALIVTPEGFPLAYDVMAGNTRDKTTLRAFLDKIAAQYGKVQRIGVMDRGIPTEETLQTMRQAEPPVHYLVGTPKGRLTKLESGFLAKPWEHVHERVEVKLLEDHGEVYVLVKSAGRVNKERAMRRRRLKKLWQRLRELQQQKLTRDQLLIKLGTAKKETGRAYYLLDIQLPEKDQEVAPQTFTFSLNKTKLRLVRRREGRYLLRSNLTAESPALMWQHDLQLTEIEQAFKDLKGDLSIRPI